MESKYVRVVMIDDDEDDFQIVRDLLARGAYNTYEPIWINNFEEGLKRLKDGDADVFLVDYSLGKMTGLNLLDEVGANALSKPIIMLTGVEDPEVDLSAMEAGAAHFVPKRSLIVDHLLERTIRYAISRAEDFQEVRNVDRLKIEKKSAEAASETKSLFLASMSHEIRTPLGAILGFAELAKESKSEVEKDEYINIETMRLSASKKGNKIKFVDLDKAPTFLMTDGHLLKQILLNLIGNASKFTENGEIEIRFEHGSNFTILVQDTGIGMSEEQQVHLFQPFSQGEAGLHRKFGGTGLGLHLSRRMAQSLMGGLAVRSSQPGVGSTFVLTLPGQWSFLPSPITQSQKPENIDLKGLSVLLAEDREDNQILVNRVLTHFGVSVEVAQNGRAAVSKARENHFDVILMDIQMPELDGFEATKLIRTFDEQIPIIALSAHASSETCEKAMANGFSDYLSKPIEVQKLAATLARFKLH